VKDREEKRLVEVGVWGGGRKRERVEGGVKDGGGGAEGVGGVGAVGQESGEAKREIR